MSKIFSCRASRSSRLSMKSYRWATERMSPCHRSVQCLRWTVMRSVSMRLLSETRNLRRKRNLSVARVSLRCNAVMPLDVIILALVVICLPCLARTKLCHRRQCMDFKTPSRQQLPLRQDPSRARACRSARSRRAQLSWALSKRPHLRRQPWHLSLLQNSRSATLE